MSIPGSANPLLLASAAEAAGYNIERSLRFNSADSAYLSRTPASAGNRKTWTLSFWVKRGASTGSDTGLFSTYSGSNPATTGYFNSNDSITFYNYSGSYQFQLITSQVFRDYSAWYHVVFAVDTTQVTSSNRVKIYVNGSQITTFSTETYPSQNVDTDWNSTTEHQIGNHASYFNGYLADIHFIDGQALTPSSFTEFSATTGQLIPKAYTGTFTGNSFWLKFADNSAATATTLGKDSSGLGNNWTPNNLSVTAGAGNDSLVDTPTSYGTDTGAGGEVRGNYCTWNPLVYSSNLSNGNLDVAANQARGTQNVFDYQCYWEITSTGGNTDAGVQKADGTSNVITIASGKTYGFRTGSRSVQYINITDAGSWTTWLTSANVGSTEPYFPYVTGGAGATSILNAGQRAFAATAPSGYKALCDTNLPAPVVAQPSTVMDVKLYAGNGSTQTISGLGFSPDLVWIKSRSAATDNTLYDTVRGAERRLESNTTDDEVTSDGGVTAFNSNGFNLGTLAQVNTNTATYAAWCWDESVSAGFDIVTYTGNGSARTISHSLGVTPNMIIVKARTTTSTDQGWAVYHSANTTAPETDYLLLNSTAATADLDTVWNDTAPTSSVFSVGTNALVNANNDTYVAYLFSAVVEYSSFGSYTGNGSADGPFVYTGFRPRWVMVKRTDGGANSWAIVDATRSSYNVANGVLWANLSDADATSDFADFLSNGFKLRADSNNWNGSTFTYIYAAFAENPFQYARAR